MNARRAGPAESARARRWGRGLVAAAAALLALGSSPLAAADTPAPAAPSAATTVDGPAAARAGPAGAHQPEATLVVFNRPIVTFRTSFLGAPPSIRADNARERIYALLDRGGPGTVEVEAIPQGNVIKIDGSPAFVLSNDDANPLFGPTLEVITRSAVQALERAISETKEARNGRLMLAAALWAGGATLIYLFVLWFLRRLGDVVTRRMVQLAGTTAGQIRVGGAQIVQRERAIRLVARGLRIGFWAIVLLVTYEWIGFVLGRFPYTRVWGEHLNAFLFDTTTGALRAMAAAVPDLIVVAVIVVIARAVNGLLTSFFDGIQSGRISVAWLDEDSARPTRRLASLAVWVFALVMAYPYIPGSGTDAFKGLSVLIGLMISVGASGLVGQAASGMILMYTRTFRPGEYVRIGEHEGTVVEMGMFTSRVRTGLGEELTLPNSLVLSSVTKNYSRVVSGQGFIVDTTVTIGYDAPWRQVRAMLIEAAHRTEGVLSDPPPRVFQTALSDFYVEYRLVCQAVPTDPRPRAEVLSSLHANVQDVFNEHGVQIMSPHYLGDPAGAKVVPKAKWYAPPAEPSR